MAYLAGVILALAWPGSPGAVETASIWLESIAEAAQSLDEGDAPGAESAARTALAAQSAGRAGDRSRLALGLALRAEERFGEAAEELARVGPTEDSLLRPYLATARADALARSGKPGAAASLFSEIVAQGAGIVSERARWREAEALLAAGKPAAALQAYQRLLGSSTEPMARLGLGAAYRLQGDEQRALDQYRKVWLDFPGTAEGKAAEQLLLRWRGTASGPLSQASSAELLARSEKLLGQARSRQAIQALDQLDAATPSKTPLPRSRLLRALALLQLNRPAESEALARPLASELPHEERPAAEWVLARATARLGRTEEASGLYQSVAESDSPPQVPGLTSQQLRDLPDDAAYLSAWLYYDAGRYTEAVSRLERFVRSHPASRRAEDARWFRAWSLYRLGRRSAAAKAFVALERGPIREAALYWHARLAPPSKAIALYRSTVQASRGGWYGLLATARLAALGRSPSPLPQHKTRPLDETPSAPQLTRAVMLFGLGLRAEALEELSSLARRPGSTAALLAQLAYQAGDAELPFRMARDHLAPTPRVQRWSHPQPYSKLVAGRCAAFGIDPMLLLAVMRRESSFQRQIRSGAGAEGLLQFIPPTAERLATLLGVSPELAGRLDEPEVSISLGAYYLGLLTARFHDPALVLAAYNAGPIAAAGWAHDRAKLPLDEWVETIPYRETRHYVRIVLADYALYRRLNGLSSPPLDPSKPVKSTPPGISF